VPSDLGGGEKPEIVPTEKGNGGGGGSLSTTKREIIMTMLTNKGDLKLGGKKKGGNHRFRFSSVWGKVTSSQNQKGKEEGSG